MFPNVRGILTRHECLIGLVALLHKQAFIIFNKTGNK